MPSTRHCVFSEQRSHDRHAADNLLAEKARKRHLCEKFGYERESCCRLGSDESKDQDRYGHEIEDDNEEKNNANTSNGKRRGGALSFQPMLGALESLIGGTASMTKAINDSKAARHQLEELQRHDRAME